MSNYSQNRTKSQLPVIALGIAVTIHLVLGLGFWNTDYNIPLLEGEVLLANDDVEAEVDASEEMLQKQIESKERLRPEDIRSLSSNSDDTREASDEDYSQHTQTGAGNTSSDDVKSDVDDYVNQLTEEAKQNRGDVTSGLPEVKDYDIKPVDNGGDASSKKFAGKTMADCYLSNPSRKSRDTRGLEIPGYTGQGSGVIFVNVVVSQIGYVEDASIDYTRTTITESYALQKALELAKAERFVRDMSAPKKQSGYFKYTYVGQ